jgi:hypothetical protein
MIQIHSNIKINILRDKTIFKSKIKVTYINQIMMKNQTIIQTNKFKINKMIKNLIKWIILNIKMKIKFKLYMNKLCQMILQINIICK